MNSKVNGQHIKRLLKSKKKKVASVNKSLKVINFCFNFSLTIKKDFPYFFIDFDTTYGYAHVIEKTKEYDRNFPHVPRT